jgi:hypothetical protein
MPDAEVAAKTDRTLRAVYGRRRREGHHPQRRRVQAAVVRMRASTGNAVTDKAAPSNRAKLVNATPP